MFKILLSQISAQFSSPSAPEPSVSCIQYKDLVQDSIFNVHRTRGDRATVYAQLVDEILTSPDMHLVPKPAQASYRDDESSKAVTNSRTYIRKANSVFRTTVDNKTLVFDVVDLQPVTYTDGVFKPDPTRREHRLFGLKTTDGLTFVAAQPDSRKGFKWAHCDRSSITMYGLSHDEYGTIMRKPCLKPGTNSPILGEEHNTPTFHWRNTTWDRNPCTTEKGIFENPDIFVKRIIPKVRAHPTIRNSAAPVATENSYDHNSLLD